MKKFERQVLDSFANAYGNCMEAYRRARKEGVDIVACEVTVKLLAADPEEEDTDEESDC